MVLTILFTIIGLAFIAVFSCVYLTEILKRIFAASYPVRDRALGKYNLKDGVSILYEPSVAAKKYIKQYQIFQNNSNREKYFIGEWAQKLVNADYNVICYDRHDNILGIYRIRERSVGDRYTHTTTLPEETEYVSVEFCRADGVRLPRERSFNSSYFGWLSAYALSLAFIVDISLWILIRFISRCLGGFTDEGLLLTANEWIKVMTITAICVIVLTAAVISSCLFLRSGISVPRLKIRKRNNNVKHVNAVLRLQGLTAAICHNLSEWVCKARNFLYLNIWSKFLRKIVQALRSFLYKIKYFFKRTIKRKKVE